MQLQARIIRADGTIEELGTVAYWHRNPLMRLWHRWVGGIKGRFHPIAPPDPGITVLGPNPPER